MKEFSPVERCRKKRWKKGTILKSTEIEMGNFHNEYYKITGFGEYEVLGIQINLDPFTTTSEKILSINGIGRTWRKYGPR